MSNRHVIYIFTCRIVWMKIRSYLLFGSMPVPILNDIYSCAQKINNHQTFTKASHLLQGILIWQRSPSRKRLSQLPLPGHHHLHQDDQEHQNQRLPSMREKQYQLLWCSRFKSRKLVIFGITIWNKAFLPSNQGKNDNKYGSESFPGF